MFLYLDNNTDIDTYNLFEILNSFPITFAYLFKLECWITEQLYLKCHKNFNLFILFFIVASPICSSNNCTRSPSSTHNGQCLIKAILTVMSHLIMVSICFLWWLVILIVYLLAVCMFSLDKCLYKSFTHFLIGWLWSW